LAGIQALTESADRPDSPLTVELHRLVRVIAVIAVAVGVSLAGVSMLFGLGATKALLDDHFASIVTAIRLGRATFSNVRRFLTYHLTDNVAELTPFVVWALTGSSIPLAIGVLQVLALDIGTDMLPAVALGIEKPGRHALEGPARYRRLVDRALLFRAFAVLGAAEAVLSMTAFVAVLLGAGWRYGETPSGAALAAASGTTFAVIAVAQMANAFACRSETRPVTKLAPGGNRALLVAVAVELVLLGAFLGVPQLSDLLGGGWPSASGWLWAVAAAVLLLVVDAFHKQIRSAGGQAEGPGQWCPRSRVTVPAGNDAEGASAEKLEVGELEA